VFGFAFKVSKPWFAKAYKRQGFAEAMVWDFQMQNKTCTTHAYSFTVILFRTISRGSLHLIRRVMNINNECFHGGGIVGPYFHPTTYIFFDKATEFIKKKKEKVQYWGDKAKTQLNKK